MTESPNVYELQDDLVAAAMVSSHKKGYDRAHALAVTQPTELVYHILNAYRRIPWRYRFFDMELKGEMNAYEDVLRKRDDK